MLRCNLTILLAERNLKITKVAHDTGISRTTLTSLCSNSSKGIQFDTMNTLCVYLSITPEQLFSCISIDITPAVTVKGKSSEVLSPCDLEIAFYVTDKGQKQTFDMKGECFPIRNMEGFVSEVTVITYFDEEDSEIEKNNYRIIKYLNSIPIPFLNDIKLSIVNSVTSRYNYDNAIFLDFRQREGNLFEYELSQISYSFFWADGING